MKNAPEINPVKALMLYKCTVLDEDFDYMEMIEYENSQPVKSYPAPESFFQDLAEKFKKETQRIFNYSRIREKNESRIVILAFRYNDANTELVFYTPAMQTNLFFDTKKLRSGNYPVPALIWKATMHSLRVYAVMENADQLGPDTQLYFAPFMNLSNGSVCLGSTEWPKKVDQNLEETAQFMVNSFFKSKFTHFGDSTSSTKSNFYTLFNEIKGKETYPLDELIPQIKLKEVMNEYL